MGISAACNGPHACGGPTSSPVQTELTAVSGNNRFVTLKQKNWQEELEDAKRSSSMMFLSTTSSKSTKSGTTTKLSYCSAALVIAPAAELRDKALSPALERLQNSGVDAIPRVSSVDDLETLLHKQLTISGCPTPNTCAGPDGSGVGPKRHRSEGSDKPTRGKKFRSDRYNSRNDGGENDNGNGQDPGETEGVLNTREQQPSAKKFDCLFHKLDPFKYECCESFILIGWVRVLQHIFRKHLLKDEYCAICRTEFGKGAHAEDLKDEHVRATCRLTTAIETGKLLQSEYDDLTGLGPGSPEEKWYKGWDKLFQLPRPHSPLFETLFEIRCRNAQERLPGILESLLRELGCNPGRDHLIAMTNQVIRSFRDPVNPSAGISQPLLSAQRPAPRRSPMPGPAGDRPCMQPPQVPPTPPGQAMPDSYIVPPSNFPLASAAARPIPSARPPEIPATSPSHSGTRPGQHSLSDPQAILFTQPYSPSMQFPTISPDAHNSFFFTQSSDRLSLGDMAVQWPEAWDQFVIWPSDQPPTDTGETDDNNSGSGVHPHPSPYMN